MFVVGEFCALSAPNEAWLLSVVRQPSDPGRPLPASLLLPAIGNLGFAGLAGVLSFPCTHTHERSDAHHGTCKYANTHLGRAGQAAVLKEAQDSAPQPQRPEYATRLYSSDYPQGYRLAKGYTRLLKGRNTATPLSPTARVGCCRWLNANSTLPNCDGASTLPNCDAASARAQAAPTAPD